MDAQVKPAHDAERAATMLRAKAYDAVVPAKAGISIA
jgi:hypothetical protein